jgi:hypothetical protein
MSAESYTDTPLLTARFDTALHYATRHHARQLRKGTPIPYASHLLACASLVLEMHGDEDEAIGALLHDVVEDGGGAEALEEISAAFGPAVAAMVLDNSDSVPGGPDGAPKPPWYERKKAYVDAFPSKSLAALRVCLADKLHNGRARSCSTTARSATRYGRASGRARGSRRACTTASWRPRSSASGAGWARPRSRSSTSCAGWSTRSRPWRRSSRGRIATRCSGTGSYPPMGAFGLKPQKICVVTIPIRCTATVLKTIDFAVAVPTPTGPPDAV